MTNDNITLEENRVLKSNPKEATEVFNNYYINRQSSFSMSSIERQ